MISQLRFITMDNMRRVTPAVTKLSKANDSPLSLMCTGEKQENSSRHAASTELSFSYKKSSPEIDAVRRSNLATLDDVSNLGIHPLPTPPSEVFVSRRIFSPVPNANPSDIDSPDFPPRQWSDIQALNIVSPRTNKAYPKPGTPFPAIKVECCDGESPTPEKTSTRRDDVKNGHNPGLAEFGLTDSCDFRKNKSLLVPSTLVRRRSTDGRLMVGVSDYLVESNLVNLSKAWSRSEGNIPGMSSVPRESSSPHQFPSLVTRGERLPYLREFNAYEGNRNFSRHKTVLEPIKQNNESSNGKSEIKQKAAYSSDSNSAHIIGNLDNLRMSQQQKKSALKSTKKLNGTTGPKPRAKSFSPRRLEPLSPSNESPVDSDLQSLSGGETRKAVRFLSPQPRRKLSPLYRDNPDLL